MITLARTFAGSGPAWVAMAAYLVLAVLLSPASCAEPPDRYSTVEHTLQDLEASPHARLDVVGRSAGDRPIYALVLTKADGAVGNSERLRILLLCGQHGNEPSPVLSMLELAREFARASDPRLLALLRRCTIVLVPVVNPDGFARARRENLHGVDLNRDWAHPSQLETRSVLRLVEAFKPHLIVDAHEWKEVSPGMPDCVEVAGSGEGTHLAMGRLLAARATAAVQAHGFGLRPVYYRESTDESLAHRSFAGRGICSMLVETSPRIPEDKRREAYRALVLSLLDELAHPGNDRMSGYIQATLRSAGSPDPSYSDLSGMGEDALSYRLIIPMVACLIVLGLLKTKGAQREHAWDRAPALRVRARRMTVSDTIRLNAPICIRLSLLRIHRSRPTDRGAAKGTSSHAPGIHE